MMKKIIAFFITLAVVLPFLSLSTGAASVLDNKYSYKLEIIKEALYADEETLAEINDFGKYIVFISVSGSENKAVTVYDTGKTLEKAFDNALKRAKRTGVSPVWFKADVVTETEKISYKNLKGRLISLGKNNLNRTMRQGIAFNSYFGRAMLDAELNSGDYLSYETGELNLDGINEFLKDNKKKQLDKIPTTLYLFKTQGYFVESGNALKLTDGEYANNGTRPADYSKESIKALMEKSSCYLADSVDERGRFRYGYSPIDNKVLKEYNIIRHAGTLWNLILQYEITGDKALVKPIQRAAEYLEQHIQYKDKNTAFLEFDGELNLGGNGISILAYVSYAQNLGSDKYNGTVKALANGILYMQKNNGCLVHSLNKNNYRINDEFIVVFYDGEAVYGLLKAYELLGSKKYLRGAEKAADYFIKNQYEKYESHWLAYAFNELTKYKPKTKYFEFGLKNVGSYYDIARRTVVSAATSGEILGASFELYDRMKKSGIECEMPEGWNERKFIKAVKKRAEWSTYYFMEPEQAMYFENPQMLLNSFAIREYDFRIRIDDIQHFMGGYYLYYKNYENITEY